MSERRYGYSAYAAVGALIGVIAPLVIVAHGYLLGPVSQLLVGIIGALVGALFGVAIRDARR